MQLVVSEGNLGTMEVQEAATGGGFAPTTALYTELVKVPLRNRPGNGEMSGNSIFQGQDRTWGSLKRFAVTCSDICLCSRSAGSKNDPKSEQWK